MKQNANEIEIDQRCSIGIEELIDSCYEYSLIPPNWSTALAVCAHKMFLDRTFGNI